MFKSLHTDFNLKQLVTVIAALWLQITVLVILCCISSPQISRPSNDADTSQTQAVNGTGARLSALVNNHPEMEPPFEI
jgi:hypothetical protein